MSQLGYMLTSISKCPSDGRVKMDDELGTDSARLQDSICAEGRLVVKRDEDLDAGENNAKVEMITSCGDSRKRRASDGLVGKSALVDCNKVDRWNDKVLNNRRSGFERASEGNLRITRKGLRAV